MSYRIPLLALLLVTAVGTVEAALDREQSQEFYEDALEYFRGESYSEAAIQLRNALQKDPDNLPARIMLGRTLLTQNQPAAAIKELEKAQAMGGDENLILVPLALSYLELAQPEHVITGFVAEGHRPEVDGELLLLQADAALQMSDTKRAEEFLLDAATLLPVDPRPIIGRARIQVAKGRISQAKALVEEALALAPESPDVWLYKALMHRDEGDFGAALKAFEKTLELDPTSSRALTARAALWLDLGDEARADEDLQAVKNLGSDSLESIYLRTLILYRNGREDEAREVLRQSAADLNAIRDDARAKLPETILMLGVVAYFEGNYAEAATHLRSYLNRFPRHAGAQRYLASAYLKLGDAEAVIKLLKPAPGASVPPDPMLLSVMAEAYRAVGNHAAAETHYAAALKIAPQLAGIGIRLAATRFDAGRPEAAIEELRKLTTDHPEVAEAWVQLVRVYVKTGALADARTTAASMVERFPDQSNILNVAGATYLATGDLEQAQLQLERAREVDPDALMPRLNLARLALRRGENASAEALYRGALEQFPGNPTASVELARVLLLNGEFDEAMERAEEVLKQDPKSFQAHELKLEVMFARRDPLEVMNEALFQLSKTFPAEPRAEFLAGRIQRHLGKPLDARVSLRRAVEKGGFDAELLFNVANQQIAIGDDRSALWTLTKAEQAAPGKLGIGLLKATAHLSLGEFERAHETLDALAAHHGEQSLIATVRGDLAMAERRPEEAVVAYQSAYELAGDVDTLRTLARARIVARQYDAAKADLARWLAAHPEDLGTAHLQAQLFMQMKDWVAAKDAYETLQEQGTPGALLLNNLAVCYQNLGDARALPTAEAAYKLEPKDPNVADTYGWVLLEQGRAEESLALLREAFARASTSPTIRYHIGLALVRLGRTEEAREEIAAAVESGAMFSARDDATTLLESLKGKKPN